MDILKQSTAVNIVMGPMLDSDNGNTPETALTISQADIRLSKNGGAFGQSNNAAGATHMEFGNYSVPLDTTDTGTLGKLRVAIHESGALAVWREFTVVPAHIYDSIVLGTDKLEVDIVQLNSSAQSLADLKDFADAGYDPATNKVQGVVLVDTCTTNTDMRGTDGANTTVPDAAGTLATYDPPTRTEATADKDAIIADLLTMKQKVAGTYDRETDSMEAIRDRGDAAWIAATGFSTHSAADVKTAIEAAGSSIASILTDTNELQTNQGAWATATGFNTVVPDAAGTAATPAEVATALTDINLDHLVKLAVDTDWATTVHLDSVMGHLADVGTAATFNRTTDALEALRNRGDAAWVAATGFSTHSAADVKTAIEAAGSSIAAILTDTNELQGDWVNGGRLDNLLDAIPTTAMRGTDGANTTVPDAAGTLATYDPPTRTEATADKDAIIADLLTMKQKVAGTYDRETDSMEAIRGRGDAAWVTATGFNTVVPDAAGVAPTAAEIKTAIEAAGSSIASILADTGTDGVVVVAGSKTGYALSEAGVDAVHDDIIEGTLTSRQIQRIVLAATAGKSSGGGTVTVIFQDDADSKARITATVDANGNRTAITKDGT